MVKLIQETGTLYITPADYIIFEGFVLFWMIAYSFLANFTVKPGFLHIFFKSTIMNLS